MSTFIYLPWVRQGLAGAIQPKDLTADALQNRVTLNLRLGVVSDQDPGTEHPVDAAVRLYGPGDVIGFDTGQVIRTEPKNLAQNFEPNYFPFIEFDRPDFPWLFTPAQANDQDQLRPWICLVVVEKTEKNLVPGQPLPVLIVDDVPSALPDLSQSWAWAYAQVADTGNVTNALTSLPEQNLSRLVCPRKLEPSKTYYACVVPTFLAGVKAGLGQEVADADPLQPAWTLAAGGVQLPVYYHWEFGTGPAGDFEALVWKLQRRNLSDLAGQIGSRPMSVPLAGVVGLEGILRVGPPDAAMESAVLLQMSGFAQDLRNVLNAPDFTPPATALGPLSLKPPIYGQWHAACQTILPSDPAKCPQWVLDLNLDPRQRAAAALGTRIVQEQQEQLMAAAWNQVEGIERANQLLRQAQLARDSAKAAFRRLGELSPASLIGLTGSVQARLATPAGATVHAALAKSPIPMAAVQGAFRKAVRPRGPLSRRARSAQGQGLHLGRMIERFNSGQIRTADPVFKPTGMTSANLNDYVTNLQGGTAAEQKFVDLAKAHVLALARQGGGSVVVTPPISNREGANLNALAGWLLAGLDPEVTVPKIWKKRIHPRPKGWDPEDPLEPIMVAPEFPAPMYQPLVDLSPDLLLPGLAQVPRDTIASLETNARFIRSYMVGLNHEMSRELLWRGFPTDQRGTYFRQFWDVAGVVPRPLTQADWDQYKDITPIPGWDRTLGLEAALGQDRLSTQTVLLIRGELLWRYPNAVIYMAKAQWNQDTVSGLWKRGLAPVPADVQDPDFKNKEKYPLFTGTLKPDLTFMCFDVDPDEAIGFEDPNHADGAGWFFILQQPPTEPRYGLDETAPDTDPAGWTWLDLAWPHVTLTPGGYIDLASPLQNFPDLQAPSLVTWGTGVNSADLASITLQRPLRLGVHASDLLPPKETP